MKMTNVKVRGVMIGLLALLLVAAAVPSLMAQPQPPPAPDPLAGLRHALANAGAPALTSAQEDQLNSLITSFHSNRPQGPDASVVAARLSFDQAILAGNLGAAQAQASTIASHMVSTMTTRLQAEANFKVQVVNVLKSNGNQLTLLVSSLGTSGVSRLLSQLAGGGPGFGPGPGLCPGCGGGPGMGMGGGFGFGRGRR